MRKIFNILFLLLGINLYSQQVVELCPDYQSLYIYSSTTGINGTYTWYINNTVYTGNTLTVNWTTTGNYVLSLYFISSDGCTDTISYNVTVVPCQEVFLYIPNAFTPNGDGLNETFMVKGYNFEDFNMMVFDRWGEMLYQTSDPSAGWNGTFRGGDCQEDVYVYVIRWFSLKHQSFQKVGHIALIR